MSLMFLLLVPLLVSPAHAAEFYNLKANSIHCATPEPIASGNIYPLNKSGCAIVPLEWGLLGPPAKVRPGVMKVEMGGRFGARYVKESAVVKER